MQSSDSEKVELYISCRKLRNMDFFSKSDPQVRLYILNGGKWSLVGTTETINDNLNPNFAKSFTLDFIFEVQQHIKFEVVDIDGPKDFDYIGSFETTLGKIMGAKKQTIIGDLVDTHKKNAGKIVLRGEKLGLSQNLICWQWSGLKLMNTDGWFGKSDPLLRFFKQRNDGEWLQVHESEVIMDNLNPIWKLFEIKEDKLSGGDHTKPIKVECWDWEKSGKYQYIGTCEITIDRLKRGEREFVLENAKKKKKTGTLKLLSFSVIERPSFLQFIQGGEQLNVVVAVDFTGSNGHPSQPSSLHARFLNGQPNQYQKAITAVSQILLNYDYDQKVPVFGFGGKPQFPTLRVGGVSHCFPCNGDLNNAEVDGLDGILAAYDHSLNHVELSGPTYFAPLLNETIKLCQTHKMQETGVYTILLILTDGEIHDMDQTIDAICNSSHLPLSIIIVGVGNADFGKMEVLDGDDGLYGSKGQKAQRDLVQFVPFRHFNGDMIQLAQRVLAEVPDQLVDYMRLVGRKPRPAQVVDINKLGFSSRNTLTEQNIPIFDSPQHPSPNFVSPQNSPYGAQNPQVLVQNPFLMQAGMNLVQNVINNPNFNMQHQPQPQPQYQPQPQPQPQYQNNQLNYSTSIQPPWMQQQGHVTLESFTMTESVNNFHGTTAQQQQNNMYNQYQNHPGPGH